MQKIPNYLLLLGIELYEARWWAQGYSPSELLAAWRDNEAGQVG